MINISVVGVRGARENTSFRIWRETKLGRYIILLHVPALCVGSFVFDFILGVFFSLIFSLFTTHNPSSLRFTSFLIPPRPLRARFSVSIPFDHCFGFCLFPTFFLLLKRILFFKLVRQQIFIENRSKLFEI